MSKHLSRDQQQAQEVKQAINNDQSLSAVANDIHVTVKEGKITLDGGVSTKQQMNLANNTAIAVGVVDKVQNNMEILPNSMALAFDKFKLNQTGTDDDLSIDIQDALGREMSLSLVVDNIQVSVEGGIVTLEGEVHRNAEKITAGNIAANFTDDDNVNNYLRVV